MAKNFKEIHIVNNTHWDREWRMSFQRTRMMLVKMMDGLLDLLEKHPEYKSYTLDSHTIMLEDYLAIRPENEGRIKRLVKARRLFIGPWYTLPDMFNISQESIVRNLLRGRKIGQQFGHVMKVGYTPCSWGQTGQLPQIYAGFGIDTILFYRGISLHEAPVEFLWEAPDGTRALTHRFSVFARYNYYYLVFRRVAYGLDIFERNWYWGAEPDSPMRFCDASDPVANIRLYNPIISYHRDRLKSAIEDMLAREGEDYVGKIFLAFHGHDISFAHPLDYQAALDAAKELPEIKIKVSNLEDYMTKLKKELDFSKLKVLRGERRGNLKAGLWTYLLPGTISSRTPLKQKNFSVERALVYFAEPLSTLAWIMGTLPEYPQRYFELAWKYLLSNHTHDAHTGVASDHTTEDVLYRYRQAEEIAESIVEDSFSSLIKHIKPGDAEPRDILVMIYNPTQWLRSEVMELILDTPLEAKARSLLITDSAGNKYDYQPIAVSDEAIFADNYWNVPQIYDCRRFRIRFQTPLIPPFGYKVLRIQSKPEINRFTGSLITAPNTMENEFLRVSINPNGTFDLYHKPSGKTFKNLGYFQDQGEAGNAWAHSTPQNDIVLNTLGAMAKISVVTDGRCATTFKIELDFDVPAEATSDGKSRSSWMKTLKISQYLTLKRGTPRLEIRTEVENTAKDHWLRVVFPTGIKTEFDYADSHFDIVQRKIKLPDTDTWKEPAVGTKPMRSFVDVNDGKVGLAILTRGLLEYEVFDYAEHPVAITLLRTFSINMEVSEAKKQALPDTGSQCLGRQVFEYAIYPHQGDTFSGKVQEQATEFCVPLRAVQFGVSPAGTLAWEHSFFKQPPQNLIVSAIKKAEADKKIILRFYNPTEKELNETIEFGFNVNSAFLLNLAEQVVEKLKLSNKNTIKLKVPPKKIITIGLQTANKLR